MSLSCSCDDWCPEPGDVFIEGTIPDIELNTKRSKKCCCCKKTIKPGDTCHAIRRYKVPEHDVEINIYGEGGWIPRANWYWCEECGDLHEAVSDLGYCAPVTDNPRELIKEYQLRLIEERSFKLGGPIGWTGANQ
jgi:hypothetical protein